MYGWGSAENCLNFDLLEVGAFLEKNSVIVWLDGSKISIQFFTFCQYLLQSLKALKLVISNWNELDTENLRDAGSNPCKLSKIV